VRRPLFRVAFVLFVTLLAGCTGTFFQPQRAMLATPRDLGLRYETLALRAADGVDLLAWFLPARGEPRATVLFLHGNAENVSTHVAAVAWMPAAGFNVLALEYRGYGMSGGVASLPGVQLDIDAAFHALAARPEVDARRIVLLGQSLGGALAIHYAARGAQRARVRALVADSAFADYRLIVREKLAGFIVTWPFQWLPALTVDNDYAPLAAIHEVTAPVLLIHGERDGVVPLHHAHLLYERAAQPKELWSVPQAGHIQALRDPALRRRLSEFLQRALQ
jgi:uncharacterized protein